MPAHNKEKHDAHSFGKATRARLERTDPTRGSSIDVTAQLNRLVRDNRLIAVASNELAGDPQYGTPKHLRIRYEHNGISIAKEFKEGDQIDLP